LELRDVTATCHGRAVFGPVSAFGSAAVVVTHAGSEDVLFGVAPLRLGVTRGLAAPAMAAHAP